MKSIADQLPPEIASQIHPHRRKNEAEYWAVRDELLDQYRGQWIGFADGRVIASGSSPVTVFHAAEATGLHPFFICVGKEDEPSRIRRVGTECVLVRRDVYLRLAPDYDSGPWTVEEKNLLADEAEEIISQSE